MGTRRDDIPAGARLPVVLEVLSPERRYGTITRLAHELVVSRQTIYTMAAKVKAGLEALLTPGQHGPVTQTTTVDANRPAAGHFRMKRMTVVLCECGVSHGPAAPPRRGVPGHLRGTQTCLAEAVRPSEGLGWT